jgi:hypothetical protein
MSADDFGKRIDCPNAFENLSGETYRSRSSLVDRRFAFVCERYSLRVCPGTGSERDPLRHGFSGAKDGSLRPKYPDRSWEAEVVI